MCAQGFRVFNSWESYMISAPTSSSGNYTLIAYDGGNCQTDDDLATLSTPWGDFPGSLEDSVDSWRVCPPGVRP